MIIKKPDQIAHSKNMPDLNTKDTFSILLPVKSNITFDEAYKDKPKRELDIIG